MTYIKRDLESKIRSLSQEYACILITGPRQVGKTTALKQIMTDERGYVTLDDLDERRLAKTDPALCLQIHALPIMIERCSMRRSFFPISKSLWTAGLLRVHSG